MLLNRGLDPNAQSNDGSTALHYAASIKNDFESADVIELLLGAHADPGVQRSDRSLPIHLIMSTTPPRRSNLPPFHKDSSLAALSTGFADRKNKNSDTTLHLVCRYVAGGGLSTEDIDRSVRWIGTMVGDDYDPLLENGENQSSLQILLVSFERDYLSSPYGAVPSALEIALARLQSCADTMPLPTGTQKIVLRVLILIIELRGSHYARICEQLLTFIKDTSDLDPISKKSPLHRACLHPFSSGALSILAKASDLSRHDIDGYTALHMAVKCNELSWVKPWLDGCERGSASNESQGGDTPTASADCNGYWATHSSISHGFGC